MLIEKIKNNLSASLFLFFYISLLAFILWGLISNFNQQIEIIVLISTFLWILFCISQITLNWREINSEQEVSPREIQEKTNSFRTWIKSNQFSELLTIIVVCIPLIVILAILGSNEEFSKPYTYTEQGKTLNDWGSILLAISLTCNNIPKLLDLDHKNPTTIFKVLIGILFLASFVLIMYSNTQIIEFIN